MEQKLDPKNGFIYTSLQQLLFASKYPIKDLTRVKQITIQFKNIILMGF